MTFTKYIYSRLHVVGLFPLPAGLLEEGSGGLDGVYREEFATTAGG